MEGEGHDTPVRGETGAGSRWHPASKCPVTTHVALLECHGRETESEHLRCPGGEEGREGAGEGVS